MPVKYMNTTSSPQPNLISTLLLSWLNPIFRYGFSATVLETSDLFELGEENKAENATKRLEKQWSEEKKNFATSVQRPNLLRAVMCCYSANLLHSALYTVIESAARMAQALLIGFTVTGLADVSKGKEGGRLKFYVPALCIVTYASIVALHRGQFLGKVYGMRLRIALCGLVFKKAFKLTRSSMAHFSTGHVINLMSNDACKFDNFFRSFHYLWLAPLELVITTYLVWQIIGWLAIVSSVYMLMLIPTLAVIGKKLGKLHLSTSPLTDRRVRLTGETLTGIRAIKMYSWEEPLAQMLGNIRQLETKKVRWLAALKGGIVLIYFLTMAVLSLLLYTGLIIEGKILTVQNVFTTMALYSNIKHSLCGHFGLQISYTLQGRAALKRFQNFLLQIEKHQQLNYDNPKFCCTRTIQEEAYPLVTTQATNLGKFTWFYSKKSRRADNLVSISNTFNYKIVTNNYNNNIKAGSEIGKDAPFLHVENLRCFWSENCTEPCLNDISFSLSDGELLAVTGPVGSGKSSLLLSILGDIKPTCGRITKHGKVVCAPQVSWIFSGTVRENILFGAPHDKRRYEEVVTACQLVSDFETFPNGDSTFIGERGLSLSGGQRTRISLARAVYFNADIYLLDDPFSALDIKVGKKLFEQCVKGLLKTCVVILVTHHLSYLKDVDRIIFMKGGNIIAEGNYREVQQAGIDVLKSEMPVLNSPKIVRKHNFGHSKSNNVSGSSGIERATEERMSGSIPLGTYWRYFTAGNSVVSLMLPCLLFVTSQVALKGSEWWLARWSEMPFVQQKNRCNIYIFTGLIGSYVLLSFVAGMMHNQSYLNSNKRLHDSMVKGVVRSPVSFFDTNPLGRVQNRFSKDLGCMDEDLPSVGFKFFFSSINCIGSITVIAAVQHWVIIAALPLIALFTVLGVYYVRTAREVKRLEATNRSPFYSHVSETLQGLPSIQQFKVEERFTKDYYYFQDEHTRAWFTYIAGGEWLGLHAELLTATFLTAASVAAVTTSADAGFTGLALYSAVNLTQIIYVAVHNSVQYESLMTSVERVLEYSELPPEEGYQVESQPPAEWPQEGSISCENVSLVYYEGGPTTLNNVTFTIKAKEKVGIVGQTGSGKSSLLAALFRMPQARGKILIDGQDISRINLQSSRAAMSVIPQDPFLFSGELRKNLDPFSTSNDYELWQVLERVQLKEKVQSLPGQLAYELNESSSNLSVGERQLVCLARALLQQNQIIVIDEATANVDFETDRKIQETIKQNFSECTVLTIAHRLDTIMGSDRVMVLSGGTVIENDSPNNLLLRRNSAFAQLVSQI